MKKCYYEILGVDKKATNSQIKSSYRKMALKYHPDKNDSEDAKQIFVQLTQAYNVLSDPNERTWYDNNRQKILFNKEQMSKEDVQSYSFGFNVWNYFTTSCFKGYDDSEGAFFQVYRNIFEKVKAEQAKAFAMRDDLEQQIRKYEGFGVSQTNLEKVIQFYEDWQNFTTYKTFVWAQDWDTRQAPNRYVKRQMEKENKKERLKEKKTYIKTIKDLVSFLKKRDPRYREYLMKQKQEEQKKQMQKKKREQDKKVQKQKMKKVKEQMEAQRYKEIQQYYKNQNKEVPDDNKDQYYVQEDEEEPEFFCEICSKEFKSENQLRNHEKSKMHKQALKQLQKQVMSKEQFVLQVKKSVEEPEIVEQVPKKPKNKRNRKKKNKQKEEELNKQSSEDQPIQKQEVKHEKKKQESEDSDDDTDAFMSMYGGKTNQKQQKSQKMTKNLKRQIKKAIESSQSDEEQTQKKKGKAKLKKQKKVANQQKEKDSQFRCNVCNQPYTSKTKLFQHLKKSGHAKAK